MSWCDVLDGTMKRSGLPSLVTGFGGGAVGVLDSSRSAGLAVCKWTGVSRGLTGCPET